MDNATAQFLGKDYLWSSTEIILEDVQALHGGIKLQIRGTGYTVITICQPKQGDRRYWFYLNKKELKAVFNQFIQQDFVTLKPGERPGIPDEARPQITLINHRGERHSIAKWAGVKDKRFDKLYNALNKIATPQEYWIYIEPEEPRWQAIAKILPLILLAITTPFIAHQVTHYVINLQPIQEPITFIPMILMGSGVVILLLGISILCEWLTVRCIDVLARPASLLISLLCVLTLLGLLFVPPVILQTSFSHWGTPTTAEITDKFVRYFYNSESGIIETDYYLKYRYQTTAEQSFNGKALVQRPDYDRVNQGDRLTVYYLPQLPRWSALEASQAALNRIPFVLTMLLTLIAWLLELTSITYLIYPLWQRLKPKPQPLALPHRP